MNHIRNIKIILKLVFVILFFTVIEIEIVYVGLSNLAAECIALLISIPFFIKHKHKNVALNIKNCSKAAFNDLGSMVAWTIIQVLGDVGLYRVENIIINKQWGITESGTLGTITEFCGYVMTIVSTIGSIFGPLILIAYSANNRDEVKRMALNQSYMVGSLAAIIAGTIAGHSVQIMRYWLGETFVQYGNWLIIKMASISFYASGSIFWFVFRAWNKIKIPALANLFLGFCNVSALIILSTWRNKSIELLLIVSSIFMIIQSYLFSGYYLNKIYKKTFLPILLSAVKMGVIFSGCLLLSISVQKIFIIAGVLKLAGSLIISCLIGLAIVYMFFYNRIIKKQFLNILGLSQEGGK
jgi:membrane protein EpsK